MRISDWSSDVCSSDLRFDWYRLQRSQKIITPALDVALHQPLHQLAVAFPSLLDTHVSRGLQPLGHAFGVVGIDDQCSLHLFAAAGETRQHQHARVIRILRCDIFLGDPIHAVTQRLDEADPAYRKTVVLGTSRSVSYTTGG